MLKFSWICMLPFTIGFDGIIDAYTCDINADTLIFSYTKLDGFHFWSVPVEDIGSCAKACLRVKLCVSFNYDLHTKICDLNSDVLESQPHAVRKVSRVVYSNIAEWPSTLDPHCHGRPCGEDEVCVPGQLGGAATDGVVDCAYSCMNFKSTHTSLPTATSPTPTTPQTTAPTTTTLTPTTTTPAPTTAPTTTTPSPITTTPAQTTTTPAPTTTTPAPTTTTPSPITTTPAQTTTTPAPTTTTPAPTTTTPAPTTTAPAPTTTTQSPITTTPATTTTLAPTTTPAPTTTTPAPTTTTPAPTTTPVPASDDIRVVGGLDNSQGRLEIYHNGAWRQVSESDWTWKATRTACRQLGYSYGGSYHKHDAYGKGSGTSVKLNNIDCGNSDLTLGDCSISSYDDESDHNKDLGITCFKENIEGSGHVRLRSSSGATSSSVRDGIAEVKYNGEWGTICGQGWSLSDEFCQLLNSDWVKDDECKDDCTIQGDSSMTIWLSDVKCEDGDEPHIFYCRNNGWGNPKDNCDHSKDVNIECKDD